ncbi:6-phospho 3-hexuloisomerase [Sulfolobus islandicus Y.G.57.14]|uniref:6-phospho-3-hexuloisomerase n=11 Tax=Saccharolobus TaxID=2100760 RepID=A0A8F5BSA9_9CREN|nr:MULTISPECIES: 6-phospho-3-hexuloisomerase [Sulfolobaceae]ACP36140.1 6-phospho 3-hexuloisomerase [Sulfolobus islandicus L.S.2.15]ACP38729.1 6-phospho 3-hexuloisomerase [Sulfolobus islandicus M.14.25]ACP46362.1 6-phospho 3-hexuloisomerase [Sulfolobus islandicus Y.G.57.14]ACP47933.1 6-phospho 3-hexuloisomerase [Sulfolobus islandicus Y.N.15.51]ACP55932.1 6-phospho 3-hexuloisomerase [Sulfolobus islandicus M.16.27]
MSSSLDDYPLSLKTMYDIAEFILRAAKAIKPEQTSKMISELENFYKNNRNGKVLVMGAGRSGLVGRAFAMRLLHLGFNSYVLGETIVPAIGKNDIVVAISGSGRTKLILTAAEAAKEAGAKLISITSYFDSPLAKISDVVIEIPGRTKYSKNEDYFARQILGITEPLAPLGTLFEDTTQIFLDGIVAELMIRLKKTEEDLRLVHANIEL